MKSDKKIIEFFQEARRDSENVLAKQYKENRINEAFYTGNKKIAFKDANLPAEKYVYFNYIHPVVNSVSGFMIQHRQKPKCLAKIIDEQEQQMRSQYINSIADTFRENANFDQVESKQDLDMLICGYGVVDTEILYNNEHGSDPEGNGEVDIERVSPNDVWWDTTACETNLIDAQFVARKKSFNKKDIKRLFNVDPDELQTEEFEFGEGEPIFNEGKYRVKRDLDYVAGTNDKQVIVHQFQWWEYQDFYRIENPIMFAQTEEEARLFLMILANINQEMNKEDYEQFEINLKEREIVLDKKRYKALEKALEELETNMPEAVKIDKRCYYTAIISGDIVLDKYKNIHQTGFTLKFKTAYFDEDRKLIFGLVSLMREPAMYNAKALTEIMKATETLAKSGVIAEKGVTDNHKEFEYKFNKENTVIWINDGTSGRIQDKRQPSLPNGYENIMQESEAAIRKTTNITPELLGNTENKNATAALERQRIKQAMTSLAVFFDSVKLYQTESMRLMIDYIKAIAENAPNKIVKIIGDDGSQQFSYLMSDMLNCEFQIDIGEAPDSPTQREETTGLMIDLADKFIQLGLGNIYPVALKYIEGMNEADKQQVIEMITPKPQPPDPLEEAQKQTLIQMMGAEVKKTEAEAMDKMASVEQRLADVKATIEKAGLDNAKTKLTGVEALQKVYNPFIEQRNQQEQYEQQEGMANE